MNTHPSGHIGHRTGADGEAAAFKKLPLLLGYGAGAAEQSIAPAFYAAERPLSLGQFFTEIIALFIRYIVAAEHVGVIAVYPI